VHPVTTDSLAPAAWGAAQWIKPDRTDDHSWSDFTLDVDFTIRAAAAGVVFRAQDNDDFCLWQINTVTTAGKVMLRPHVKVRGAYTTLAKACTGLYEAKR
jgi:hypothetical protein